MKRRKFISVFALLPPLLQACEKDAPPASKVPTVVTGKVIDEDNMPVKDFTFSFLGKIIKTFERDVDTFALIGKTDENGICKFSKILPYGTNYIQFIPGGFEFDPKKTALYVLYVETKGKYELYTGQSSTPLFDTDIIFNFQLKKR